jgi:O-antigen/teichoic acid export membrane protein
MASHSFDAPGLEAPPAPVPRWRMLIGNSVALVTATVLLTNVLRLGSTIVLTRLLSPADFGATAIFGAIVIVFQMISDLGFHLFVVRHRDGDVPRFLDVIWTIRLVRSALLTIVLALLAGPLAMAIGQPALTMAIAVTGLHFLIEGLASMALITTVRDQRLFKLSAIDIAVIATQIALGLVLAWRLESYWAIVWAGLAGAGLKTVLSYVAFPATARRLAFDRAVFNELWRFGRTIVGSHTIQVTLAQLDKFVLARLFPLSVFGTYGVASNLAGAPSAFTALYPSRVLLPAMAAAWRADPAQLPHVYYAARRRVMLLYMLAMGMFVGFAPAIVAILYDPRYAAAGPQLAILAVAPLFALNNCAAREVFVVVGRVQALLYANLVRLGWLGLVGTGGYLAFGPMGFIAAIGTIELPVLGYSWWELQRHRLLRPRAELAMLGAAGAGVGLGLLGERLHAAILGG